MVSLIAIIVIFLLALLLTDFFGEAMKNRMCGSLSPVVRVCAMLFFGSVVNFALTYAALSGQFAIQIDTELLSAISTCVCLSIFALIAVEAIESLTKLSRKDFAFSNRTFWLLVGAVTVLFIVCTYLVNGVDYFTNWGVV